MKILFVCTGNTCRSPMAEYILKNKLKGHDISSAGLSVYETQMMQTAKEVLKDMGIEPNGFVPRQLTSDMVVDSNLIICMTKLQKQGIISIMPEIADKVVCSYDYIGEDIMDPYGMGKMAYEDTASQLDRMTDEIINLLFR